MDRGQVIDYQVKLWQTRSKLLKKGCAQPVAWMIERGLWNKTDKDWNYLGGRIVNSEFLEALESLLNQIENE